MLAIESPFRQRARPLFCRDGTDHEIPDRITIGETDNHTYLSKNCPALYSYRLRLSLGVQHALGLLLVHIQAHHVTHGATSPAPFLLIWHKLVLCNTSVTVEHNEYTQVPVSNKLAKIGTKHNLLMSTHSLKAKISQGKPDLHTCCLGEQ